MTASPPKTFCAGLFLLLGLAFLLLVCYSPHWQTYDDVVLAMLIKGYGIAAEPSLNLLYCNFLWAWLIQLLPDFFGISSYTLLLYFFSLSALVSIWYALCQNPQMLLLKWLLVLSMLFYAFLNPQFTVTALLCITAGGCLLIAYQNSGKLFTLILALLLFFFGFLIRDWTLPFIAILTAFFINWKALLFRRSLYLPVFVFIASVSAIYTVNLLMKTGTEWEEIISWNNTRQNLTDAHQGKIIGAQPDLLRNYGYSENDMRLLSTHFSLARPLMDNGRIGEMKRESDPGIYFDENMLRVGITFAFFLSYPLILLVIVIAILLCMRLTLPTFLAMLACAVIFFMFGFFNRGGIWISRVYYPGLYALASFLLLYPESSKWQKDIFLSAHCQTLLAGFFLVLSILAYSKANLVESWEIGQKDMAQMAALLDKSIWYGHPVRIEQLYAPFANMSALADIEFQGASWTALLPNARSWFDIDAREGFDDFLRKGFRLSIAPEHLPFIETYCAEHLGGRLETEMLDAAGEFYNVRCQPPDGTP